jgi:uncharacterized integral membrane protein
MPGALGVESAQGIASVEFTEATNMDDYPVTGDERDARRRPAQHPHARGGIPADRTRLVLLVVAAVIVLGVLIFWLQNHQRVSISYLTVTVTAPLWLTVTAYFLVGIVVGIALTTYYRRRQP